MIFRILVLLIIGCSVANAAVIGNTEDPYKIAIGARSMGMGGVYAAVIDGSSNMFNNPAGMYGQQLRLFSMSTSLLGDVEYRVLGGNWPLGPGYFGLGYAGSSVGSIITPTQAGFDYFDYRNNVTALSYALKRDKVRYGARLKFFEQGFSGSQNYIGNGFDLDLGAYYAATDKIGWGLVIQNALPVSLGGRVNWPNGDQSSLPVIARLGVASSAWRDNVLLALDADFTTRQSYQSRLHGGAEWTLNQYFRLRSGLDQSYSADGVSNSPTFGVGLRMGVVSFDYAYHPYFGAVDGLTHYFSLAFSADDAPKPRLITVESRVVAFVPPTPTPEVIVLPPPQEELLGGKKLIMVKKRIFHYISKGENFSYVSNRYYGVPDLYPELAKYNNIKIKGKDQFPRGLKYIYIAPTGELLKMRTKQGEAAPAVSAIAGPQERISYVPKPGDTLITLAIKYYGEAEYAKRLGEFNGLEGENKQLAAKTLIIPPLVDLMIKEEVATPTTTSTTLGTSSTTTTVPTTTTLPPTPAPALVGPTKTVYHYPSSGDTMTRVSIRYYGTDQYAEQLASVNNVLNVKARLSGMAVKVPTLAELFALSPATMTERVTTTTVPVTTTLAPVTTTLPPAEEVGQVGPTKTIYHYTSSGDNLVKISEKYYGTADYAEQLAKLNNLTGIKKRLSGKVITVPPLSELE